MPEPRYRALLIANSTFYRDPDGLPELKGPREDVKALRAALTDPDFGMFEDRDVEPVLDHRTQSLKEELERFYLHEATRDDVLLLYYSGHGKLDVSNRLHLCASDTRTSSLRSTALRYKEDVEEFIDESPAAATITVLDCCHSGGFRGGKLMVEATGNGRCVLTSSAANQLAIDEVRPGGPSPFTEVLVRGLQVAKAQLHLTTQELYNYVKRELGRPGQAKPQYYFNGAGEIVLARRATAIPAQAPPPEPERPTQEAPEPLEIPEPEPEQTPVVLDPKPAPTEPLTPDWTLPRARNRLEHTLSQAVDAALWAHLEDPGEENIVVHTVAESAAARPEWTAGVVESLPIGPSKRLAIQGMVIGLFDQHREFLTDYISDLEFLSPDYATAKFTYANVLPADESELISSALDEAMLSARHIEESGHHRIPLLPDLCSLFLIAQTPGAGSDQFSDSIVNAAWAHLNENSYTLDMLFDSLYDAISETLVTSGKPTDLIEVGRRLAGIDPHVAASLLGGHADRLTPEALADVDTADIAELAVSLLKVDHPLAFQFFEMLSHPIASGESRPGLLSALLSPLSSLDTAESTFLDRLFHEIERIAGLQDDAELGHLSHFAEKLAGTAPRFAERLLELDPDEERRFGSYLKAIGPASETGEVAAHRMALAAERIARAVRDEHQRPRALLKLAAVFARINPEHAIRLLRSSYAQDLDRGPTVEAIAEVFASTARPRLTDLAIAVKDYPDSDKMLVSIVKGIAPVLPDAAISFANEIEDQRAKSVAFTQFVIGAAIDSTTLIKSALGSINPPKARAEATALLVRRLAETSPALAVETARSIDIGVETSYAKAFALIGAARAVSPEDPAGAERHLSEADHYALKLDKGNTARPDLLRQIAVELTTLNPGRAVELLEIAELGAKSFPDSADPGWDATLADIMIAWAPLVPANSERLAEQLSTDMQDRDDRLRETALALAAPDPRRAERIARMISHPGEQNRTLLDLVEKLSATSTARAERIAASLPQGEHRARGSLLVAKAMAGRVTA